MLLSAKSRQIQISRKIIGTIPKRQEINKKADVYIREMTYTYYVSKKKEEEDSPELKIV